MNVTNTSGGNVQSNGSIALEDGHLIGYSIVLEGVTSISSEVMDALGITQSAIANGGGSSGTTGENEKEDFDSPKVNYKGEESSVYRGGDDFTVKSNEVKIFQKQER